MPNCPKRYRFSIREGKNVPYIKGDFDDAGQWMRAEEVLAYINWLEDEHEKFKEMVGLGEFPGSDI